MIQIFQTSNNIIKNIKSNPTLPKRIFGFLNRVKILIVVLELKLSLIWEK